MLIVDDQTTNRAALAEALEHMPVHVLTARDAEEALEVLAEHDVSVAMLDVQMPGINGIELARTIRRGEKTPDLPIIFVTAFDSSIDALDEASALGASDFLFKPFRLPLLRAKLSVLVELHSKNRSLENALATLKESQTQLAQASKLSGLGRLGAGIAHELKQPLTGILGNAEMLKQELQVREPGAVLRLQRIYDQGKRMAGIIDNIRRFARETIHDPKVTLAHEPLEAALELIGLQLEVSGLLLDRRYDLEQSQLYVKADPITMQQVFLNLLENARDAVEERAADAELAEEPHLRRVRIDLYTENDWVVYAVQDSGSCIEPANQDRVFYPFFTSKPVGKGTGLGLSVVHRIVAEHRGTVKLAESSELGGAKFLLKLPRAQAELAALRELEGGGALPASAPEQTGGTPEGKRLLIVDDEPVVLETLEEFLRREGYEVDTAANGEEAQERIRNTTYHTVIADIRMSKMGGLQLTRWVCKHHPDLPVLLATGWADQAEVDAALEAGARKCLRKPLLLAQLAAHLDELLGE